MIITNKQALALFVLLGDTCKIEINDLFTFNANERCALYNEILEQQGDEEIDLELIDE